MKKIITLFGSLLIFAGVKAQTTPARKETAKPLSQKPATSNLSSIHKVTDKGAPIQKVTDKGAPIQMVHKESNLSVIKGNPATSKGAPIAIKGTAAIKGAPAMKEVPAVKQVNR